MNQQKNTREERRQRRRIRVRARISGTATKPRLNLHRSARWLFAQLINDADQKTLVSIHAKSANLKEGDDVGERTGKVADAYLLGKAMAVLAKEKSLENVVFDRAGYKYHGRVKAFAEGARDGGLKF